MPITGRAKLFAQFVVFCKLCAVLWLVGAMPAVWFFVAHGGLPYFPGPDEDGSVPPPGLHFSSDGELTRVPRSIYLAGVFILATMLLITPPALLGIWYGLRAVRCPGCGAILARGHACPYCPGAPPSPAEEESQASNLPDGEDESADP